MVPLGASESLWLGGTGAGDIVMRSELHYMFCMSIRTGAAARWFSVCGNHAITGPQGDQRETKPVTISDEIEDPAAEAVSSRRGSTIQSVSAAAQFLRILANAEHELPLGEIARRVGTGRSTAHRYLQTLVKEGLARQDAASGHYDLGPLALSIGIGALKRVDPVELAAGGMKGLALRCAMSGGVAVWTERGPTLVRWYRSAYFSITPLGLGDILPVDNTACGLVFQAYLPPAAIETARAYQAPHFRSSLPGPGVLAEVRAQGWAELTSHLLSNVTGQAAPVFDAQGEIACVVTTVTDLGRLQSPEDRLALKHEARRINEATGGMIVRPDGQATEAAAG